MIKELNHIGILTRDMPASRKFYEEVLGGIVIRDYKDAEGLSLYVYVQLARGVVELIRVPADAENYGYVHVAFLTEKAKSLDAYYEELAGLGYEFTVLPKSTAAGDGRLAFYKDKSNALFELIERDENIRVRDHVSDVIKAYNYTAIYATPDMAKKCGDFYQASMSLKKTDAPAPGQNVYTNAEDSIMLMETNDAALLAKPLDHVSFCVADLDKTRSRLTAAGIKCTDISAGAKQFEAVGGQGEKFIFTTVLTKK